MAERNQERARRRVRRDGDRVWIDGVARLRWGQSAEPTYVGALEAAFRGSDRPLDVTTLLGDSGLAFRLRWAMKGESFCGSGPCGEWPEEIDHLNAATGYHYAWFSEARRPLPPERRQRIVDSIESGYPILGYNRRKDMAVFYGCEGDGQRVLVADYWGNQEPDVAVADEADDIAMFLVAEKEPLPRAQAVRAGLALAVKRWRDGVVEADATTGSTYYYGAAGYAKWIADLERADTLSAERRANLFFLNGWTYSSLSMNRRAHAAAYLRANAVHLPEPARPSLEAAALCYDRAATLIGPFDFESPLFGFIKQQRPDSWTDEVRARELALLVRLAELDGEAIGCLQRALTAAP